MGIITGYYLSLADVDVTYLIRPHRKQQLSRTQLLYSYDDRDLKSYSGYKLIDNPKMLIDTSFDYIVITLDGASLKSESGERLAKAIGKAYRDKNTGIIIGSVGVELRPWFIEHSGLESSQVAQGLLATLIYEAQKTKLPLHDGIETDLLSKADYAFKRIGENAFNIDLSAPTVASGFKEMFDQNGVAKAQIIPESAARAAVTGVVPVMALEALGWKKLKDIEATDEVWRLGVEAQREFQSLSIFGAEANTSADSRTAEGVLKMFHHLIDASRPMDFDAFNKYHHGGKVNQQDREVFREALKLGEAEGRNMPAMTKLVSKLSS